MYMCLTKEQIKGANYAVLVVGHRSSGKSCLVSKLVTNKLPAHKRPTSGADVVPKMFSHEASGEIVRLQIWDISGQEKFKAITFP